MGDYRDKSGSERVDAPEKIDLTNVMLDVYHGVKRLWWLFIGLIIICAVQSYFSVFPKQKDIKKQPMFTCLQTKEYCY